MKAFHGDFAPCLQEMGVQYVCGYWILGEFHDCLNPAISKVDAQKWLVMSRVHNSPPIIRRRCPQFRRNRQLFDSGTLNGKKCKIVGRNSSAILRNSSAILRNSSAILKTCSLEKKSSRNCFSSLFWVSSELLSGCAKLPQHEIHWNSWVWLWKKNTSFNTHHWLCSIAQHLLRSQSDLLGFWHVYPPRSSFVSDTCGWDWHAWPAHRRTANGWTELGRLNQSFLPALYWWSSFYLGRILAKTHLNIHQTNSTMYVT